MDWKQDYTIFFPIILQPLENKDKIRSIQNKYIRMLERYLLTSDDAPPDSSRFERRRQEVSSTVRAAVKAVPHARRFISLHRKRVEVRAEEEAMQVVAAVEELGIEGEGEESREKQ